MNKRNFLNGLFGSAAVLAAGPIPKALEALSDKDFTKVFDDTPRHDEVYGNGKDYAFAKIEWLEGPPYFKVTIPKGYRPLREESDRLADEIIPKLKAQFKDQFS